MLTSFQEHLNSTDLLPPQSKIVMAVSGGVDSVSLLNLISQLQSYYNWQLVVAHFDHKVRSDSYKDSELVATLAEKYNAKYFLGTYISDSHSEAALRKARYEFLENLRNEIAYDYIVTAHHAGDRIETAIFNTIRGADRSGITALKARRDAIIRPLLPFTKAEILTYANLQGLPYREDSTNTDISFSRNFVRHELLPQGSLVYRNFHHSLTKQLNNLTQLNTKIDQALEELVNDISTSKTNSTIELDKVLYRGLSTQVATNLLVYCLHQVKPGTGLTKQSIVKAENFLRTAKSGSSLHLKNSLRLEVGYDNLRVMCQPDTPVDSVSPATLSLTSSKPFNQNGFTIELHTLPTTDKSQVEVPAQKLYIRYRNPGDRISPVGMKGSKKIQDIFVDKKIDRKLRDTWPIVVNAQNQVVWIPNIVASRHFVTSKNPNTKTQFLTCKVT